MHKREHVPGAGEMSVTPVWGPSIRNIAVLETAKYFLSRLFLKPNTTPFLFQNCRLPFQRGPQFKMHTYISMQVNRYRNGFNIRNKRFLCVAVRTARATLVLFQLFLCGAALVLFTNTHCQRFDEAVPELPVAGWVSTQPLTLPSALPSARQLHAWFNRPKGCQPGLA